MEKEETIKSLMKALDPTNKSICYYNPLTLEVSENKKDNWIFIEPLKDEILECITDFIYETEDEFLENEMNQTLRSRQPLTAFINYLIGKKVLTKNWNKWKKEWLREQAIDFLNDVEN